MEKWKLNRKRAQNTPSVYFLGFKRETLHTFVGRKTSVLLLFALESLVPYVELIENRCDFHIVHITKNVRFGDFTPLPPVEMPP